MAGLLDYSGIVTKIRAKEKNFITDAQFREITSLPSVEAIVVWLKKDPAYEDALAHLDENNLHRGQIEFEIGNAAYKDFASIYHFANGPQRSFLEHYGRRYEIKLLKRCMNAAINGQHMNEHIKLYKGFYDRYTELDLNRLYEAVSMKEVLEALKGTSYYEPLERISRNGNVSLFDYETALDQFYFSEIWKDNAGLKTKDNIKIIRDVFGTKFDVLNLWWINRARSYYKMSTADTYAMLIPIQYKLKEAEIKALVEADSQDAYRNFLKSTYYGRVYEQYLSPENLQNEYNYLLRHILGKLARQKPYSIATLYNFLYMKEHEVNKLTIAIECVRYGLSSDEAMKMIAEI